MNKKTPQLLRIRSKKQEILMPLIECTFLVKLSDSLNTEGEINLPLDISHPVVLYSKYRLEPSNDLSPLEETNSVIFAVAYRLKNYKIYKRSQKLEKHNFDQEERASQIYEFHLSDGIPLKYNNDEELFEDHDPMLQAVQLTSDWTGSEKDLRNLVDEITLVEREYILKQPNFIQEILENLYIYCLHPLYSFRMHIHSLIRNALNDNFQHNIILSYVIYHAADFISNTISWQLYRGDTRVFQKDYSILQNIFFNPSVKAKLESYLNLSSFMVTCLDYKVKHSLDWIRKEKPENLKNKTMTRNLKDTFITPAMRSKLSSMDLLKLENEIRKMESISPGTNEYEISKSWLERINLLPWGKCKNPRKPISLSEVRKGLDAEHYGMNKIKDTILEYLSILKRHRMLKLDKKDKSFQLPVLCLIGPPGVGKTTIAKSIAKALGREFASISLGGLRDLSELKGHRRTYIGSTSGLIIDKLIHCKFDNPVILLDEIDKTSGLTTSKDISSVLLDILDSSQNTAFRDSYIDIDYDISKVLFIATANTEDITPALADRMSIIYVEGYTFEEKMNIIHSFILPKAYNHAGVESDQLIISDEIIHQLIDLYTHESGVRNISRILNRLVARYVLKVEQGEVSQLVPYHIDLEEVTQMLGPSDYSHLKETIRTSPEVGIVHGLAYTQGGGMILEVETTTLKGKGEIHFTGNVGKILAESVNIAYIVAKKLIQDEEIYNHKDVYLNFVSSVSKDGPSCGAAITLAIYSALTGQRIRRDFGITGSVSLLGNIERIGGVREKITAAINMGIKNVVLPEFNRPNVEELSDSIKQKVNVKYIKHINEVLEYALVQDKRDNTEH